MRKLFNKINSIAIIFTLLICLIVLSTTISLPISAQSPDEPWSPPVNLSHSGATTNPLLVVDSDGVVHVIWEDEFAGWIYTRLDGDNWATPVAVEFPFAYLLESEDPSDLWLVPDTNGRIHAFWGDEENILFHSSVESISFGDALTWQTPMQIAESALGIDVVLDSQGNIHLAYVRAIDDGIFPAGIYYRYLSNRGSEWSQPEVLYQSRYFRSLSENDSNVEIATMDLNGSQQIYVTWDNRPRKRTFLSKSSDGGVTWGDSIEVSSPETSSGLNMPFNTQVFTVGEDVLRIWQSGEPGSNCSQHYQWSTDGGDTWTESQIMLEDQFGCPQNNQLFTNKEGVTLLMTTIQDQIYLLAWNGSRWSTPQLQSDINYFEDPETFIQVKYRCRQSEYTGDDQMLMVGCDEGEGEGGDIWFTSRQIGIADDWFPPLSVWSEPTSFASTNFEMTSPVLVADSEGRMHSFWSQKDENSSRGDEISIFHAQKDGEKWSRPVAILRSPTGVADNPSVGFDSKERLMVVWSTNDSGEIYFSWANADQANNVLEWAEPQVLSSVRSAGSSPQILVDFDRVLVVYAIPLNEHRGIYLTSSEDGGETWAEPVQIFDGVAAGWEMVSEPRLTRTRDGKLHVIWIRRTLPGGIGPQSLHYSMSEDGGITWTDADLVMEGPVTWSEIAGTDERTLHRMWLEESGDNQVFRYQYSQDGGLTWIHPAGISTFGDILASPSLVQDAADDLHLIQIAKVEDNQPALEHWTWNGERLQVETNLPLSQVVDYSNSSLGVSMSQEGDLGVIFNTTMLDETGLETVHDMNFSMRPIDVGEAMPTFDPLPAPPSETPDATSTPSPHPTHTPIFIPDIAEQSQQSVIPLNNSWGGILIASVVAILVVGSVSGIYILGKRTKRR